MSHSASKNKRDIAIIGMSCRLPGANSLEEFWNIISEGRSQIKGFPADRLKEFDYEFLKTKKGSFLENPYLFDNDFFNISYQEAQAMDPQQRIMLELTIEALNHARLNEFNTKSVGVYLGANQRSYIEQVNQGFYRSSIVDKIKNTQGFQNLTEDDKKKLSKDIEDVLAMPAVDDTMLTGNISNMISARISHEFNLMGPSLTVDTACSSSLVATHLACEALKNEDCKLALAGGINLNLSPSIYRFMEKIQVISPSGNCIPFSSDSDGILLGEGAGLVILKRYDDAIKDGDKIWGVIKGTGVNNDGRTFSVVAPSWKGQTKLLESVYSKSGYDKTNISYIEAHGTSTKIGDSVEITVLDKFFDQKDKEISIGSVKSNIGHLLGASGIAGLIKSVLTLNNKKLAPSLYGEKVNSKWNLKEKGFKIQDKLEDWNPEKIRAIGINAFGFGGTNAHVILEESKQEELIEKRDFSPKILQQKNIVLDPYPGLKQTENSFYQIAWEPTDLSFEKLEKTPDAWIIFNQGLSSTTQSQLTSQIANKIIVNLGSTFSRKGEKEYELDYYNKEQLRWLFESLKANTDYGILYFQGANTTEDFTQTLAELQLVKNLLTEADKYVTNFWCISKNAFGVSTVDSILPHSTAVTTLVLGGLEEKKNMLGGVIDYAKASDLESSWLANTIQQKTSDPIVIRDQKTFKKKMIPATSENQSESGFQLSSEGVYLILGGSSGVGEEIATHLHTHHAAQVIITGTRNEEKLSDRLNQLVKENLIEYQRTSVLHLEELEILLSHVIEKYGKISGIIYAAGKINFATLTSSQEEVFNHVLQTKIRGISNLINATKNINVNFIYLFSSISGLNPTWSKGMTAYASANAYLDALAIKLQQRDTVWFSRSWSVWEGVGMNKDSHGKEQHSFTPFDRGRGIDLFIQSLKNKTPHLVILDASDANKFSNRINTSTTPTKNKLKEEKKITKDKATPNDFTEILTSLISKAIDVPSEEIDPNEYFTNLGLDSITALDLAGILEQKYDLTLAPTLLFEYDTIHSLAKYLNSQTGASKENKLTATQKAFYTNHVFYPEVPCNIQVSLDFEELLDIKLLSTAWNAITQNHESLSSTFRMTDHGPRQILNADSKKIITCKDFKEAENSRTLLESIQKEMINKHYALEVETAYDLCYVEKPKNQSTLILNSHHIMMDAWSMTILLKELVKQYRLLSADQEMTIAEAPKFSDYQKHILTSSDSNKKRDSQQYWNQELKNYKPPHIKSKESSDEHVHGVFKAQLNELETKKIDRIASNNQLSIFHILTASYFLQLRDISKQDDLVVRLASANRDRGFPGITNLTGCIADSIPMRIQIRKDSFILSLAAEIRRKLKLANVNKGLSSLDYNNSSEVNRNDGPNGISPFGISYINLDHFLKTESSQAPKVSCRVSLPFTLLSFMILKQDDALEISWNYSKQHFTESEIEHINKELLHDIQNIDLTRLDTEKRVYENKLELPQKILFKDQTLLHKKVFAACKKYKSKNAIVEDHKTYTYNDLHQKSYQIANGLLKSNTTDEEAIGVLSYPGAMATMGILGILASGKAYIPLDPDWPIARIDQIIKHSEIKTILTITDHVGAIHDSAFANIQKVLLIDKEKPSSHQTHIEYINYASESKEKIRSSVPSITSENLAYVMYTSGTTGSPKGVMVDHASASIFLSWLSEEFNFSEDDKFIQTSSLGFGGSLRQIFSTLLAGGEMHPINRHDFKDPHTLLQFLEGRGITILNTVPSVLQNICSHLDNNLTIDKSKRLKNLRLLLIGGEILPGKTVAQWRSHFENRQRFVNLYGSTETIVNATIHDIPISLMYEDAIPIGIPRKGSHVLLLNEEGKACAMHEKGELYVGGPSIAKGYYKEKNLTNQRFIESPIIDSEGKYYKTGDLAIRKEEEVYHFLGRSDNQIQIYGNRIEPSEIELVLSSSEFIKAATIVDHKDDLRHFLIAFVVPSTTAHSLNEKLVREMIRKKLPAYMVPSKVEFLEQLPMNHAGKIDRKSLQKNHRLPSTKIELKNNQETIERIQEIWIKVFNTKDIDIHDDFFLIGGDSILAIEVLHHIRKAFKVAPKPVELYRKRSIIELAKHIDEINQVEKTPENSNSDIKLYDGAVFPLSATQKGFYFLDSNTSDGSANLIASIPITGSLDKDAFRKAVGLLIKRHEILRTRFIKVGLNTSQQILTAHEPNIEIINCDNESKEEQEDRIQSIISKHQSITFNLASPPLHKLSLVKTSKNNFILIASMHHIIGDGWSFKVIMNELISSYEKIINGEDQPPIAGTSSFRDIVNHELKTDIQLKENNQTKEKEFWKSTFAQAKTIKLPKKYFNKSTEEKLIQLKLTESQKSIVQKICLENEMGLYQLFFTLYARALAYVSNESQFLINTAISGRDLPIERIKNIIGPLAKSLPVGIKFIQSSLKENYEELNDSFLNAFDHKELPNRDLLKLYMQSGKESVYSLSAFFYTFMDFNALTKEGNHHLKIDWDQAIFSFDSESMRSELMLGIRIAEGIHLNFGGKTNAKFKTEIKNHIEKELTHFIDTYNPISKSKKIIDAALIAYFPSFKTTMELMPSANSAKEVTRKFIDQLLPDQRPKLLEIENTKYGKTGLIFLPYYAEELLTLKKDTLLQSIRWALEEAVNQGAKNISLAGNLPSLTNYGFDVRKNLKEHPSLSNEVSISTGHSCTVVAVVKNTQKILEQLNLKIEDLSLTVVGFGSIGQASLDLIISKLGIPGSITIADLTVRIAALEKPLNKIRNQFPLTFNLIEIKDEIPKELYQTDLIIGASSKGEILNVEKIIPGTIIVDDSFPHIVNCPKAVKRMTNKKDIIILGGGKIDIGKSKRTILETKIPEAIINKIINKIGDHGIPGCRAESLLMNHKKSLEPTIGLVTEQSAEGYWNLAKELELSAVAFHLQGFQIDEELLRQVKYEIGHGKIRQ